jgi:hypothetical protein
MDKIIKTAKQFYEVGKVSPDIRKCAEIAVDQIIGNKELSQHCIALGITKKDYIDFILKNL